MALAPGTRLGVYDITAPIGEGGMGQVYRATDMTLGRQVAIKILPDAFASDPERLARFEREAKTLASLNHPHIAAIYGFEKPGGLHALVMELVEGEDLSQRIARGAIPLDDALPIATQIAEALEAAHEQGIIHRDLKPANVKVRGDGTVKVLDFGLAKATEPASAMSANAMNSPTLSMHATQAGIILGTAAYMSPEQAAGKPVDKRSDLWAFGVVLMEMLTGRPAFSGETVSHVLAAVLRADPDWSFEIYVRPFPGPGGKWPISTGGGADAVWSRARRELLYMAPDGRIMLVPYTTAGDAFQAEKPRVWSETPVQVRPNSGASFDLHPDGERVAMAPGTAAMARPTHVTLIFNFFDELRRLVPAGRR